MESTLVVQIFLSVLNSNTKCALCTTTPHQKQKKKEGDAGGKEQSMCQSTVVCQHTTKEKSFSIHFICWFFCLLFVCLFVYDKCTQLAISNRLFFDEYLFMYDCIINANIENNAKNMVQQSSIDT